MTRAMHEAPGRVVSTHTEALPGAGDGDADLVEVVLDSRRDVWGRFFSGSTREWSPWWRVASAAEAAAVTRWDSEELSACLISTAHWRTNPETSRPGAPIEESTRSYFLLSKDGVTATRLD